MRDLSTDLYEHQEVIDMLHGKYGTREIRFKYLLLDKNEQPKFELLEVESGSVEMQAFSDIKRTAKFRIRDTESIDWLSDRIQPYIEFKMSDKYVIDPRYRKENFFIANNQNNEYEVNYSKYKKIEGTWISYPLGVFILSTPKRVEINDQVYRDVDAYDGLVILREDKFTERYTVTAGTKYTDAMIGILQSAGITKHNIEDSDKVLPSDRDWKIGTEKIRGVNDLSAAINYTPFWVDEYGYYTCTGYTSPSDKPTDYEYTDNEMSVTYNGMEEELDLFNVPNSFTLVLSDTEREPLISSKENNNIDSPTSIPNRGRRIVDYREVQDIADQQTLDAKVDRIANEASQIYGHVEFETAIMPFHGWQDVLQIRNETLGIDGWYAETAWSFDLSVGGSMKHEVRKVVKI